LTDSIENTAPGNAGLCTRAFEQSGSERPNGDVLKHHLCGGVLMDSASTEPRDPRGWHSRGYLPHFDSNEVTQHVTFRLADSLPKEVVERLAMELRDEDPVRRESEKRRRLEAFIDAGYGACWLRRSDCARVVQESLLHFDGERYRLIAWVVMPNHVHVLFQTMGGWSMDSVVGSWKTFTANAIGRLIEGPDERVPKVWHPEFWDRYIRDERHFVSAVDYIHNNPVKAGLVSQAADWLWGSASPGNAGLRTRAFDIESSRDSGIGASTEPRDPRGGDPGSLL
jgi:REP element-mobilizing transposase RayT